MAPQEDDSPAPAVAAVASAGPTPGDHYVQSFARGLAVIRSFGRSAPAQTLSEVAAATGLTRAGARRILLTLQGLGYVVLDGRHFRLTPRILDLGFAYLSSQPLWNLAEPVMEELVAQVHESCSAAVLDGAEIVYVLRVPTQQIMTITLGVGSRLPAHCTAMGRVLLADLDEAALDAWLARHPPSARTPRTIVEPDALKDELARVRAQGWSLVDEELEPGLVTLAVPLRDRGGRTIAAMNVSGAAQRTPPQAMRERVLPALQQAAARIGAMLALRG